MNTKSRRDALKCLTAFAPAVWIKPVVNASLLPVHATGSLIELQEPEPLGPGAECVNYTSTLHLDFAGGNYVDGGALVYTNPECTNTIPGPVVIGTPGAAYAPDGTLQAEAICRANTGDAAGAGVQLSNGVWTCALD